MTRTALLKIVVVSGALFTGSSAADGYILIYGKLSCTYAPAAAGKAGPVKVHPMPTVTIRNIGTKTVPGNTPYTVKHLNPAGTITVKLARSLGFKQQATAPVQANWGKASRCTATAPINVPISGGSPKKR